jgi:hypothetical protein
MSSAAQDPFYIVREEIQDSVTLYSPSFSPVPVNSNSLSSSSRPLVLHDCHPYRLQIGCPSAERETKKMSTGFGYTLEKVPVCGREVILVCGLVRMWMGISSTKTLVVETRAFL